MRCFVHTIDNINIWVAKFISWWIIFLTVIILYEIIMRYVFNRPTIWVHETGVYIFGFMWVMGGGYTLYQKAMVNMDVLYMRFSERGKAILDLCTSVFAFVFCAVLLWKSGVAGWQSVMSLERSTTSWAVPYYPIRLVLPIGAALLLLQLISKFIKDLYLATGRNAIER